MDSKFRRFAPIFDSRGWMGGESRGISLEEQSHTAGFTIFPTFVALVHNQKNCRKTSDVPKTSVICRATRGADWSCPPTNLYWFP